MDVTGPLSLLESDGVAGAKLQVDRLELYLKKDLKRWLVCRDLKTTGSKEELIQRYEIIECHHDWLLFSSRYYCNSCRCL